MGIPSATTVIEHDEYGRAYQRRALVDSDVLDIARRLIEGDPVAGWRGEASATLYANPIRDPITGKQTHLWEVECLDAAGRPYIAASLMADRVDHRIIEKMVLGDWQRGKVAIDEIMAANQRLVAQREQDRRDAIEQIADKFHFGMLRAIGHLEGGTRRLHSMSTGRN